MRLGQKFDRKTYEDQNRQMEMGFIRNFPDGDTTVRFLEEIESARGSEWVAYSEHWSETMETAYCCLEREDVCPGCRAVSPRERKTTRRYLVNAYSGEYVNVYKVPASLIPAITKMADRYGTITDRDYTVIREGKGLNTKYTILPEDKSKIDIEMFRDQMKDLHEMLAVAFKDAWKMTPEEMVEKMEETGGEYVVKAALDASKKSRGSLKRDEEDEEPKPGALRDRRQFDEDPPFEPREPEGETEVTEEELRDMSRRELRGAYRVAGIDWPDKADDMSLSELVDHLIEVNEG